MRARRSSILCKSGSGVRSDHDTPTSTHLLASLLLCSRYGRLLSRLCARCVCAGDRSGSLKDAWGIRWTIATRVKEVSSEDVKRAGDKWIEDHPDSFNKHSTTADHTAKTE